MKPYLTHELTSEESQLVTQVLSFIQQLKDFKNSDLESHQQILSIYKKKKFRSNQKPTFWQTLIYSVRKLKQKPFDLGKELFEIIFLVIFCPYFSSKPLEQSPDKQSLKIQFSNQSQFEKLKRRQLSYTRSSNIKVYNYVLKQLNIRNPPLVRQWFKDNCEQIKVSNNNKKMTSEEIGALMKDISNGKNLQTLEYAVHLNCYFQIFNYIKSGEKSIKKFRFFTMKQLESYGQTNPTGRQYKIWRCTKRKILTEIFSIFAGTDKIKLKKHFYLAIESFLTVTTSHQKYQKNVLMSVMHQMHVSAEKGHNLFLADMLRTRCFKCESQRFVSSSIHKTRIYQCLSRKLFNVMNNDQSQMNSTAKNKNLQDKETKDSFFDQRQEHNQEQLDQNEQNLCLEISQDIINSEK